MSIGYAYIDGSGYPYPNTVSETERAAMVNALVSIFGKIVTNSHSDAAIKRMFDDAAPRGHYVRPVEITLVEVDDA